MRGSDGAWVVGSEARKRCSLRSCHEGQRSPDRHGKLEQHEHDPGHGPRKQTRKANRLVMLLVPRSQITVYDEVPFKECHSVACEGVKWAWHWMREIRMDCDEH